LINEHEHECEEKLELAALAGFFSYTFFEQFAITRDFPSANLLLFAAGGICLVVGLLRAFGKAQVYRGKIFGPILATLAILMFSLFSYVIFYQLRQVPPSTGAPRVGQKAPEFTLSDVCCIAVRDPKARTLPDRQSF
jgi:hypothetical protein